jgi:secreted trypsin-like serine protease
VRSIRKVASSLAAIAATTGLGLLATGGPANAIVGGAAATRPYEAMASLQFDHRGDPDWQNCGATLVDHWYAVTNAHCVTKDDGSARDEHFHIRVGSLNRRDGGVVAQVAQILPNADWHWAVGGPAPASDIAMLKLAAYVPLTPYRIPFRVHGRDVREIGWGLLHTTDPALPLDLQQLDTQLLPLSRCAAAGITVGELCLDSPDSNSGACYGDSGGPGLQRAGRTWVVIGGASRETVADCGIGPNVYTDLTFFRQWIFQVIRTGTVPPATTSVTRQATVAAAHSARWIGSRGPWS